MDLGLKNVWEVCQQILCMDLKKNIFFFGGGVVMPKYFTDLKNVGGGYANKFVDLKKCWGGGGLCPNILDFKNVSARVCQQILWT